jgi:hypothetical protein
MLVFSRLLKNTLCCVSLILRHCDVPKKYASFLRISRALHLDVFDQPEKNCFFNNLLEMKGLAVKVLFYYELPELL